MFPEGTFLVPRCVVNLKPTLQAEALGQVNRLFFTGRSGACSVCCLCYALGVMACRELSLWLFQPHGAQKHKFPWPPEPGNQGVCTSGFSGVGYAHQHQLNRRAQNWHPLAPQSLKRAPTSFCPSSRHVNIS